MSSANEQLKQRIREMVRVLPSREACEARLRAEGLASDDVKNAVEEVFAEKKARIREACDHHQQRAVLLTRLMDGEEPPPLFRPAELAETARERREVLAKDIRAYGKYTLWNGSLVALFVIYVAQYLWAPFLLSLRLAWLYQLMLALGFAGLAPLVHCWRKWNNYKHRLKSLDELAGKYDWW